MDNPQPLLPDPQFLPSSAPPSRRNGVFVGPSGLRAGWRFFLFNVLWIVFVGLIFSAIRLVRQPPKGPLVLTPWFDIIQELVFLLALTLTLVIMLRIERRPFQYDWLPKRELFGKNFWVGSVWGFCSLLLLLVMMRGLNDFYFGAFAIHGWAIAKFAFLWAIGFIMVGLFEESFSRGYGLRTLASGLGFWPATVITSLIFGAMHISNGGEGWLGIASVVAIAFILCFTLWRTGNLWFAVGLHFGWDYAETFVFGVPDSGLTATGHLLTPKFQGSHWITGGTVGPEGSVLVFVVYALLALAFHFAYPERRLSLDFSNPRSEAAPAASEPAAISA